MTQTIDFDWDVKIKVEIVYPSIISGSGGQETKEITLVNSIIWDSLQPVEKPAFVGEFSPIFVFKSPTYTGSIRVAATSDGVPLMRYLHANREYFDAQVSEVATASYQGAPIKGRWKATLERFIGCVCTRNRGNITPDTLPFREFSWESRYTSYGIEGATGPLAAIGDGWTVPGDSFSDY